MTLRWIGATTRGQIRAWTTLFRWARLGGLAAWLCAVSAGARAAEPTGGPNFQEVLEVIRTNLPPAAAEKLNAAAVRGLLSELRGEVLLVTNHAASNPGAGGGNDGARVARARVLEDAFGYVRLERVAAGAGAELPLAIGNLQATNKLKALVLDLRFAGGQDYAAVAEVAGIFLEAEQPIFKAGQRTERVTGRTNALALPLAVLVNRETAGAAEVLAAVLRQKEAALVIGQNTAGQAHAFRDVPLSTGQTLKIAADAIEIDGGPELSTEGLAPDIRVTASAADERLWLEDPYRAGVRPASAAGRNAGLITGDRPGRRRINEAELVRMQREGIDPERDAPPGGPELATVPTLQDPALARALDILKGLTLTRGRR